MAFNASPQYPGSYLGVRATNPPNVIYINFIPTPALWQNLNVGDIAIYTPNPSSTVGIRVFILISVVGNQGTWAEFTSASGDLQHLTGNDAIQVNPDAFGNINIVTLNSTVKVANTSANTEGIDFGLTNLILGSNAAGIVGVTTNVGLGRNALNSLTTGDANVAIGNGALGALTTGNRNTAVGVVALNAVVTGSDNTALGEDALSVFTGSQSTAVGSGALANAVTGTSNTAVGFNSMLAANGANFNTALGSQTLTSLTTGTNNTAISNGTLQSLTTGTNNTAIGFQSMVANVINSDNTAVGTATLAFCTSDKNTAVGAGAGGHVTTGQFNTYIGDEAGINATIGSDNTSLGKFTLHGLTTGSQNTVLGSNSGTNYTTESDNIVIGYNFNGQAGDASVTRIKNIFGVTPIQPAPEVVIIDSNGQLGSTAGGVITATVLAAVSQGMGSNIQYIVVAPGVSLTLPATSIAGDIIRIVGRTTGVANNWTISQGVGQQIDMGPLNTTLGAGGSLASSDGGDCVELMCTTANTIWRVYSSDTTGFILV